MLESGVITILNCPPHPISVVFEVGCSPEVVRKVLRRALQGRRAVVRSHPGKLALRIAIGMARFGRDHGALIACERPGVPYRFLFEIDPTTTAPTIRIVEYDMPMQHKVGKVFYIGPLFTWIGSERMQQSIIDKRKRRTERREIKKRAHDKMRVDQGKLDRGEPIYLSPADRKLREDILKDRERDKHKRKPTDPIPRSNPDDVVEDDDGSEV